MAITDEKELADAILYEEEVIYLKGEIAKSTRRFLATGRVTWGVVIGAITVAVAAILAAPATGGASSLAAGVVAPAAVGVLGVGATTTAITLAVTAGGVGVLKKLRKYSLEEVSDDEIILRKA